MHIIPRASSDWATNLSQIQQRAQANIQAAQQGANGIKPQQPKPSVQANPAVNYQPVFKPQQTQENSQSVNELQQPVLTSRTQGKLPVSPQNTNAMNPMVNEVADIAQKSGFVGLSTQDVLRAYAYGTSLLADYSV